MEDKIYATEKKVPKSFISTELEPKYHHDGDGPSPLATRNECWNKEKIRLMQ